MRAVDLVYDGTRLSDLGYFICDFSSSSSADSITAGSELTFTTVPMHHGVINPLVTTKYDSCYETSFCIAKDVDSASEAYLSMSDISMLMKWLVRKDFHELILMGDIRDTLSTYGTKEKSGLSEDGLIRMIPYYCLWSESTPPDQADLTAAICGQAVCGLTICGTTDGTLWYSEQRTPTDGLYEWVVWLGYYADGSTQWGTPYLYTDVHQVRFNGSFTAKQMEYSGRILGLELSFTSDRPFGYLADVTEEHTFAANESYWITPSTDELGFVYPEEVKITLLESGNLTIRNDQDDKYLYIANCQTGEVITLDCIHQVIQSSYNAHQTLYNDFNYNFFRLVATLAGTRNDITPSLACTLQITYKPICKAVF